MDFTSRQLRAFHLVADYRNFTRAAEALFLTPSGLSVLRALIMTSSPIWKRTSLEIESRLAGTDLDSFRQILQALR
jgi:hypothetical protein